MQVNTEVAVASSISNDDVQAYLQRIVEAGVFESGSLRHRLLDHLIRTELDGHGDTLKAYTIGLDVFEKPDTFDPSTDSSVRVGIGRLRTALALFENSDNADIALIVDVPVGTYRPVLTRRQFQAAQAPVVPAGEFIPKPPRRFSKGRLIWACAGFACGIALITGFFLYPDDASTDTSIALEIENFTGDQLLARQTSSSLRRILSTNQAITIISDNDSDQVTDETDLVLNGHVTRTQSGRAEVTVEMTSPNTNSVLWARASMFPDDAFLQSRIEQALGQELRVQVFNASRADLEDKDPQTLTPEQLYIIATWRIGTAANALDSDLERVRLMEIALEKDPNFGAAHSVMANKMAYLANVHAPSNAADLRTAALDHARRARELSPLNPYVMFSVAQTLWHSGQIAASQAAMDRVVDLKKSHVTAKFLSVVIPYTCRPAPDDILQWVDAFDADLATDSPARWMISTWRSLIHTNRAEYEEALIFEKQSALVFDAPYGFMRRAMLLNKLGRTQDAMDILQSQDNTWPDVNPTYFAEVTIPRLCSEDPNHSQLIEDYRELVTAMAEKI